MLSFIIETPLVPKLKQFLFINVKLIPSQEAQNDFTHDSRRIRRSENLFCLFVFIILISSVFYCFSSPESQV